ncbi:hypothetical protein FSARC_8431 [Fusarium sarcochroum]|uniref:Uncharacterized protein n=1 Tax=Fusarium sarcochroum TaxID=1208366 RepID=A0A8H4TSX4_9HYPO|nr:hypothetical protein FSARC_8431 [Fusarium sarcochroum]
MGIAYGRSRRSREKWGRSSDPVTKGCIFALSEFYGEPDGEDNNPIKRRDDASKPDDLKPKDKPQPRHFHDPRDAQTPENDEGMNIRESLGEQYPATARGLYTSKTGPVGFEHKSRTGTRRGWTKYM